jgi:hypothetical protein
MLDERNEVSGSLKVSIVGKGKRLKHLRREQKIGPEKFISKRMTINFQKELRNSEIWDQMVAEFGEEKAEQLLRECKAELKPGDDL